MEVDRLAIIVALRERHASTLPRLDSDKLMFWVSLRRFPSEPDSDNRSLRCHCCEVVTVVVVMVVIFFRKESTRGGKDRVSGVGNITVHSAFVLRLNQSSLHIGLIIVVQVYGKYYTLPRPLFP